MKDGSLITMDVINSPEKAHLNYKQLNDIFSAAPRAGFYYARDQAGPGSLAVGKLSAGTNQLDPAKSYIYKMVKAGKDNPKLGCKKGDAVISLVNPSNPSGPGLYYYVADDLFTPTAP